MVAQLLYHSIGEPKIEMTCESWLPMLSHQIIHILLVVVDTNAQSHFAAQGAKTEETKRPEPHSYFQLH